MVRRLRERAAPVTKAAAVTSRATRHHDQVERDGDGARRTEVIWPAWVQRCGIGSSCDCAPQDQMAGVQRDLQRATAGGGAALPAVTQATMERAFSADFSAVRVHTGAASERVASGLGARALTSGQDILFQSGAFRPRTPGGDRLLAHELAHVVQQAGGLPRAAIDGGTSDPLEKAAEMAADRAVTSGLVAGLAPAPSAHERDSRAADPAQALRARADTAGHHVVFAGSHVSPASTEGGKSLASELSHVVPQSSGAAAIQRAPERDDDDETVVKGPRPIELMLRPDDPSMCGGRKCMTDEELDPAALRTLPTTQAELNEEAARLGEMQARRRKFWDLWDAIEGGPSIGDILKFTPFHKKLVDLGLMVVTPPVLAGFRRVTKLLIDPTVERTEQLSWDLIYDNAEAKGIYWHAHDTVMNALDEPEEESWFHRLILGICENTNPCKGNLEQMRADKASGMDPDEARNRALIRTGIAFLPLEQPQDLFVGEESIPFGLPAEPSQLEAGNLGTGATETEPAPEPPMQMAAPKGTSKSSAVGKGAKASQAWPRTNTSAGRLPRFSGRGQRFVTDALQQAGFKEVNPNEWVHPDGSYVRIDPPHAPGGAHRSHNEPHYHKQWREPVTKVLYNLDDAGYINPDPGQTHIIGR